MHEDCNGDKRLLRSLVLEVPLGKMPEQVRRLVAYQVEGDFSRKTLIDQGVLSDFHCLCGLVRVFCAYCAMHVEVFRFIFQQLYRYIYSPSFCNNNNFIRTRKPQTS